MMVFSVPISLQIPLKLPDVYLIENSPFSTMTDPFDIEAHPPCLMNISTGIHATREVHDYLLSAVNEGEKMCRNFVNSAVGSKVSKGSMLLCIHALN
jgi:hypothetical protein